MACGIKENGIALRKQPPALCCIAQDTAENLHPV